MVDHRIRVERGQRPLTHVLVWLNNMIQSCQINFYPSVSLTESDRAVKGVGEEMALEKSLRVNKNSARAKRESYYRQKAQAKQRKVDWKEERDPKENCREAFEAVAW